MCLEPVPGQPLPERETFDLLANLVPCDVLGAAYTDFRGRLLAEVEVDPGGRHRLTGSTDDLPFDPDEPHHGPHYLGYMHWSQHRAQAEACSIVLGRHDDGLAIGFRNGVDHVVQYYFGRRGSMFTEDELVLLWMLGPILQRLVRERPTPSLPPSLTTTERRILSHVASGLSNREIAGEFHIAISTVRKHLENSYRKLGVTSRVAAVARLQGRDVPSLDLRERLDRYA